MIITKYWIITARILSQETDKNSIHKIKRETKIITVLDRASHIVVVVSTSVCMIPRRIVFETIGFFFLSLLALCRLSLPKEMLCVSISSLHIIFVSTSLCSTCSSNTWFQVFRHSTNRREWTTKTNEAVVSSYYFSLPLFSLNILTFKLLYTHTHIRFTLCRSRRSASKFSVSYAQIHVYCATNTHAHNALTHADTQKLWFI